MSKVFTKAFQHCDNWSTTGVLSTEADIVVCPASKPNQALRLREVARMKRERGETFDLHLLLGDLWSCCSKKQIIGS